jgi:hypothetical protein
MDLAGGVPAARELYFSIKHLMYINEYTPNLQYKFPGNWDYLLTSCGKPNEYSRSSYFFKVYIGQPVVKNIFIYCSALYLYATYEPTTNYSSNSIV